jgi:hypothetical protein
VHIDRSCTSLEHLEGEDKASREVGFRAFGHGGILENELTWPEVGEAGLLFFRPASKDSIEQKHVPALHLIFTSVKSKLD